MRQNVMPIGWRRLREELRSQTTQLQLLNSRLQSLALNVTQTNSHLLAIAGQSQRNGEQLEQLNKYLGGFIGSVADSVEDEVVKAVENAQLAITHELDGKSSTSGSRRGLQQQQQQQQPQRRQLNMKFMLNYKRVDCKNGAKILYEIDGVGFACDPKKEDRVEHAVLVEAKHKVRKNHLMELLEKINRFEVTEGLSVRQAFIGGPKFSPQLQREAIRLGLGVVVLSGKRFTVMNSLSSNNDGPPSTGNDDDDDYDDYDKSQNHSF